MARAKNKFRVRVGITFQIGSYEDEVAIVADTAADAEEMVLREIEKKIGKPRTTLVTNEATNTSRKLCWAVAW